MLSPLKLQPGQKDLSCMHNVFDLCLQHSTPFTCLHTHHMPPHPSHASTPFTCLHTLHMPPHPSHASTPFTCLHSLHMPPHPPHALHSLHTPPLPSHASTPFTHTTVLVPRLQHSTHSHV